MGEVDGGWGAGMESGVREYPAGHAQSELEEAQKWVVFGAIYRGGERVMARNSPIVVL